MNYREHGPLYQLTIGNGLLLIGGVAIMSGHLYLNTRGALILIQSNREDRRIERAEARSARHGNAITRNLDRMRLGEMPDGWEQE